MKQFYACLFLLLAASLVHLHGGPELPTSPRVGEKVPQFAIRSEQGKKITNTRFGGKLLIINFWHTSCRPCVKELPSLSALGEQLKNQGLVVVAIAGDEDPQQYQKFLKDHPVSIQTLRDPTLKLSRSFGTEMFPETYLIRKGRLVKKVVGDVDWTGPAMQAEILAAIGR